ncbi:transposase [bacterium]|nr:transposase [bacterium]
MNLSFDRKDLTKGCTIHVFNRGNARQQIFLSDADFRWFLNKADSLHIHENFEVIAFCLMPNHFHYYLRLKNEAPISRFFQRLQLAYAKYFNRKYEKSGHVFEGPFNTVSLNDFQHITMLPKYIHMNPVAAGLTNLPGDWIFSNYQDLINGVENSGLTFYNEIFGGVAAYKQFVNNSVNADYSEFEQITFESKPI